MLRHGVRITIAALVLAALFFSFGGSSKSVASSPAKKTYTIYLSNNFLGNDWRQQMERSAKVSVRKGPLAGRVNLKIQNVENTVQAQINSLNNIISTHPDALLIDAGSATALNPVIARACAQHIIVISFDQVVTAPCAYKMESNWDILPKVVATWAAEMIHGHGNVFIDHGLPGAPISAQIESGYKTALSHYPGIKIIGYFNGQYAFGPEQSGVASLLAAHPNVNAILTQGYGAGAMKALQQAGHKLVPVVGYTYNVSMVACATTKGASCVFGSNAPYVSSNAIRLAVNMLDGKPRPNPAQIIYSYTPYYTTNVMAISGYPHVQVQKIKIGVNTFPKLPGGLTVPFSPSWVHITPQEAAGTAP